MRKIYAVMAVMLIASACSDSTAPVQKKVYPIALTVQACSNSTFSVNVQWAGKGKDWQSTFYRGTVAVAAIRDTMAVKSSGCVYRASDNAKVNLYEFGFVGYNADSASVVVK